MSHPAIPFEQLKAGFRMSADNPDSPRNACRCYPGCYPPARAAAAEVDLSAPRPWL